MLWSVLYNIPARDAIRVVPESFSPGLMTFIKGPGSLMEMLGFQHLKDSEVIGPDVPETGIFGNNTAVRCKGNAANFINDLAKHLQDASMLGRFLNFQSITAPLRTSEFTILYENAKNGREELLAEKQMVDETLYGWRGETSPTSTTRATEAILSLKGSFIPSIPVGAIRMLTRETGKLTDQSVEGYFANIQKVDPARQQSMPDGDNRDFAFFVKVSKYLHPTSLEKRAAAEREKERNGQGGYTSKERSGKIHVDVRETDRLMNEAVDRIYDGFITGFVNKFKDSELELGRKILENRGLEGVGTNKNEDDLYTEKTKAVAQRVMDEEGVTCAYASEVTKFMFLLERFTSVPIRRGTHSTIRAQDTFFNPKEKGALGDFIWTRIKDDQGQQKLSVIHWKHAKITDAYVLMVVYLRAVFKLHHGDQIDPEILPLNSKGHKMDDQNRNLLLKTAGKWFLGLPGFSEHGLRNVFLTMAIYVVSEAGLDPETHPVVKQLVKEVHTTMKVTMEHYDEDRNARAAKGLSMYNI
ncbi:unnamed protein product, partial [Ectocarpus sp. 13 AM-2016]